MSSKKIVLSPTFFEEVRGILAQARQQAYAAINFAMVEAYWQIGRRIVEEEQNGKGRADYGAFLIKELSKQLTAEFGKGFAAANLKNFRQFYLTFPDFPKGYALRSPLTWSHYRLIMRVDNPVAREYYIREAADENWSTRQLERNIHALYYERLLASPDKPAMLRHESSFEKQHPAEFVKDPYVLEFLQIPEAPEISERQLETAVISNLQHFLLELGKGFSFVGRQFRISTETSHFYIDLVFYNYLLKCFVLIDLKTEKLTHQDIGQVDMYVRMFDDLKRGADDNPTVGIIFCAAKDETVVRYSVLKDSEQLFASKYRLILPTEEELVAEIQRERRLIMEQRARYETAPAQELEGDRL
ncbi:MAG TPA: PDDEXK nuclease domain-containing protein [Anaerolineales bacterium]|nr:PDDEXK nuclease domain-containing protein [Anaerolineales bacterium]